MARRKPARPAKRGKKKAAPKAARRKAVKKSARKAPKKASRKAAKKARKARPKPKATVRKVARKAKRAAPAAKAAPKAAPRASAKKPNLDRPRKTVADIHGMPSSWGPAAAATAASTGRAEMNEKLQKNTNTSPALTAGDVDADWQSAGAVGDEAPGGDNPTPDQDVVDEIGRALGVEYADDEELQGGAEITERDVHRWELDPSSKDDFDETE